MNLYLITHDIKRYLDYDTYDMAVVAAPNKQKAKEMHPDPTYKWTGKRWVAENEYSTSSNYDWCKKPDQVTAKLLGKARKGQLQEVICASFNAG